MSERRELTERTEERMAKYSTHRFHRHSTHRGSSIWPISMKAIEGDFTVTNYFSSRIHTTFHSTDMRIKTFEKDRKMKKHTGESSMG